MNIRSFLTVAAALLSIGCTAPQGNPHRRHGGGSAVQAVQRLLPRSSIGLQDECTRRMGEAYCQRCLVQ
jgi:hypothetical protein